MATPAKKAAPKGREEKEAEAPSPDPDRPLSRNGWIAIGACILAANVALIHRALRFDPEVTVSGDRFTDDFNREHLGPNYFTTGMQYRILDGELFAPEGFNNPLWLKMKLPRNAAIEFDASSDTGTGDRPGDIKFEIFGNGRDHASGYICVFGGWANTISIIGRLDEHGLDRKERKDRRVEIKRVYHMRIERLGSSLRWFIDNDLFLVFDDPQPLEGSGHDRFGFSSYKAELHFDNLKVEPL